MTAVINKLKDKQNVQQLPVTHERAVRDSEGTTLETKLQNLEGAMDKAYVAQSDNGMGRITLKKNMVSGVNTLTQSMMQATNTIYVIRYDFTLGEDITIPDNCVLEFEGGSISGAYTITGQNTILIGKENCIALTTILGGTWKADVAYSDWFSVVSDCILNANMTVNSATDSAQGFSNLFLFDVVKIKYGNYYCSHGFDLSQITHKIIDGGGANIKIIPGAAYTPLFCINYGTPSDVNPIIAKDVVIKNLNIIGNLTEETASAADRGSDGLHFGYVDGLVLENISAIYCANDCLYLGNGIDYPKNVKVTNCHFEYGYRNNISITSGTNIHINNCIINNVEGSGDPEAGIDIEPNNNCVAQNIIISNCRFKDNKRRDILFASSSNNIKDVTIVNCIGNKLIDLHACERCFICNCKFYEYNSASFVPEVAALFERKPVIVSSVFNTITSLNSVLKETISLNGAYIYYSEIYNCKFTGPISRLVSSYVNTLTIKRTDNGQLLIQNTTAYNITYIYAYEGSEHQYGVIITNGAKLYNFYFDNQSGSTNFSLFYLNDSDSVIDYNTNGQRNIVNNSRPSLIIFRGNSYGTTTMRPNTALIGPGFKYYDVTISKLIMYNGSDWVNLDGSPLT